MARKTLDSDSNSKRKDVAVADLTADEALSSVPTKKRKIEISASNNTIEKSKKKTNNKVKFETTVSNSRKVTKKAKSTKNTDDSKKKLKKADNNKFQRSPKKLTQDSTQKVLDSNKNPKSTDDSKKKVKTPEKKVKFESPVKRSAQKLPQDLKVDSKKKAKSTDDSSRKVDDLKKKVKKKVKFGSPVKAPGIKDEADVKKVKKSKVKKEEVAEGKENGAMCVFPMNRVIRIVKSQNSDVRLSAEAAFLFNKASEKFLELFSQEAYACASKDGKKKIEYQHLSSLIPGNTRFDFLSDFVPAKVKAADALKKIPLVKT